jgi:hypothetical protein
MAWEVGKYSVSLNFNPKSNNLETTSGFVKGSDVSTHDCTSIGNWSVDFQHLNLPINVYLYEKVSPWSLHL